MSYNPLKAYGSIFGSGDSFSAAVNFSGATQSIPVVYGDDEVEPIWLGFRQVLNSEFGALAVFCYASIEEVEYLTINGVKFYPGEGGQFDENSDKYGVSYNIIKDGGDSKDDYARFTRSGGSFLLPPDLGLNFPRFFRGLVGVFLRFDVDEGFITGIPTITMKLKGKNHVFDPRVDSEPNTTSANGWTGSTTTACTNPALIYADYLTNTWYGKGLSWDRINLPALIEAANVCDTPVLDGDGNTIPLMAFNGRLDTSEKIDKNLELIAKHMRAHSTYHNKQFNLVIRDDAATPDVIPEKWIEKHFEISHGEKSTRLNSCLITYKEPAYGLDDNQVIWPESSSEEELAYLAEDGGEILQEEITLSGCRNRYQAIDYAESIVRESRLQLETKLKLLAPALKYQAGDVVDVPLKGVGLTHMRITTVDIHDNLNVTWSLLQHSNDSYPWTTKLANPLPAKDEPDPLIVDAPANVAFTPDVYNEFSSGVLSWDAIGHMYVTEYSVSITNTDTGVLVASYKVADVQAKIQNLPSGNYSFSVRALISLTNGPVSLIAVQILNPEIGGISNFRIAEGGTEFIGRDCVFSWGAPSNAAVVVHDYVIEILDPNTGDVYFNDATTDTFYTFTYDKNLLAGLYRTFKIKVYARGKYGQDNVNTGAAELVVNNPLPTLPDGVATSSQAESMTLEFVAIGDPDFKCIKVWLDSVSGFSPSDGQQRITTSGNQITLNNLTANSTYYLRYGILDALHSDTDIGVVSGELIIYTAPNADEEATRGIDRLKAVANASAVEQLLEADRGITARSEIKINEARVLEISNVQEDYAGRLVLVEQGSAAAGLLLEALTNNGSTQATAALYLDVDGAIAGVFTSANDTTSNMVFRADNFAFKTANGTKTPFAINGENVEIINALIKASINVNDQFTVDAQGNVVINNGVFKGSLDTAIMKGVTTIQADNAQVFGNTTVGGKLNYVSSETKGHTDIPGGINITSYYFPPHGDTVDLSLHKDATIVNETTDMLYVWAKAKSFQLDSDSTIDEVKLQLKIFLVVTGLDDVVTYIAVSGYLNVNIDKITNATDGNGVAVDTWDHTWSGFIPLWGSEGLLYAVAGAAGINGIKKMVVNISPQFYAETASFGYANGFSFYRNL
ncbi:MAG: hypothetical protein V7785_22040 [Bermanella sp.]